MTSAIEQRVEEADMCGVDNLRMRHINRNDDPSSMFLVQGVG